MLRSVLVFAAFVATASAQTYTGRLAPGDETLGSGEYVDEYVVDASVGQTVRAVVTSDAFDPYVIVKSASGEQEDNDDCTEGDLTRSCAAFVADRDGLIRVLVTSFEPGETGDYRVVITTEGAGRGQSAGQGLGLE